jgi:hypothetical protein
VKGVLSNRGSVVPITKEEIARDFHHSTVLQRVLCDHVSQFVDRVEKCVPAKGELSPLKDEELLTVLDADTGEVPDSVHDEQGLSFAMVLSFYKVH